MWASILLLHAASISRMASCPTLVLDIFILMLEVGEPC